MTQSLYIINGQTLQSVNFTGPGWVSGVSDDEASALMAAGYATGAAEDIEGT